MPMCVQGYVISTVLGDRPCSVFLKAVLTLKNCSELRLPHVLDQYLKHIGQVFFSLLKSQFENTFLPYPLFL